MSVVETVADKTRYRYWSPFSKLPVWQLDPACFIYGEYGVPSSLLQSRSLFFLAERQYVALHSWTQPESRHWNFPSVSQQKSSMLGGSRQVDRRWVVSIELMNSSQASLVAILVFNGESIWVIGYFFTTHRVFLAPTICSFSTTQSTHSQATSHQSAFELQQMLLHPSLGGVGYWHGGP